MTWHRISQTIVNEEFKTMGIPVVPGDMMKWTLLTIPLIQQRGMAGSKQIGASIIVPAGLEHRFGHI